MENVAALPTEFLATLHKTTRGAILNHGPSGDDVFPFTSSYPAPRGKTVEIVWESFDQYWATRRAILKDLNKVDKATHKGRTEAQRQYARDLYAGRRLW